MVPLAADAAAPRTFRELVFYLIDIMNYVVGILIIAGVVIYFLGAVQHLYKTRAGEAYDGARNFLLMGAVILFVMVSVWGLIRILQATFLTAGDVSSYSAGSGGDTPCLTLDGC